MEWVENLMKFNDFDEFWNEFEFKGHLTRELIFFHNGIEYFGAFFINDKIYNGFCLFQKVNEKFQLIKSVDTLEKLIKEEKILNGYTIKELIPNLLFKE